MSATGADPQAERPRLREESRTWGLIRRTLPLGKSIGSLAYLTSVGLIASWIIVVFFGVGLFSLMPRSAKLESGLSPGGTSFDASLWLTQSTSRLDRLSDPPPAGPAQPMGDAAADKGRPVVAPGSPITATVNPQSAPAKATIAHTIDEPPGHALTVELGTISAASGEAGPMPAPQSQLSRCARTAACLAIPPLSIISQAARTATPNYPKGTACPGERN
jgi:hypothetical protein